MRVLHVTPAYPPTWAYGGIPRVVYGLARAQRQAGIDVRIWTTDVFDATRRSGLPARSIIDDIEVVVTRVLSNRLAWGQQLYLPTSAPPMDGVDVVHLHSHRHLLNFLAWKAARRQGLPVVQTPNGTAPRIERKIAVKAIWDRLFDGDIPRDADRVIATSKAEIRQLLQIGVPADRVVRIPNGLYLDEFRDTPPRGTFRARYGLGDGPLVSYLGQVTPRKGVQHLVEVFKDGALAPARLVVAGATRGMELPEAPEVLYTGTLEGNDRLALLADTDVLVYPSSAEVFGLVPFEGLMCGAPVVVGDDCGCGELITEANAGRLTPYGDVPRLRAAIQGLLSDRATADAMVARGQKYIAANLDFHHIARTHIQLYESLG